MLCKDDKEYVGLNCVSNIIYRNAENVIPFDTPPDIYSVMSEDMRIALVAVGSLVTVLAVLVTFIIAMVHDPHTYHGVLAVYSLLIAAVLAGGRTIVAGVPFSNSQCTTSFWLGHLAYLLAITAAALKLSRLQIMAYYSHIISKHYVTNRVINHYIIGFTLCVIVYLTVASLIGRPYLDYISTTISNQTTHVAKCSIKYPEFEYTLNAVEGFILLVAIYADNHTKTVIDITGDKGFYSLGKL